MFLENTVNNQCRSGWIEVITGSMFSGKTEELIRRLKRARISRQKVEIFKPQIDIRYSETDVVSHDATSITSTPVTSSQNILLLAPGNDVIGIDEAQFFDEALIEVCEELVAQKIRVILAGLDMDYLGRPFGTIPILMAKADFVTKVHAICMHCGDTALHSHRIMGGKNLIEVGETKQYIPLCRTCFIHAQNL